MFDGLQVLDTQGFVVCGAISFDSCNFDLIRFVDCVWVLIWWFGSLFAYVG